MKKIIILIVLTAAFSVRAQTADEKETLKKLNETVVSLYGNKKFDDAAKSAQQAVDLSLKIYGNQKIETAVAYTNLGLVLQEKGKYSQSIENLQKAAEIYQGIPNLKNENLIKVYGYIAFAQLLDRKNKEAEANYLKATEIAASVFGVDSRENFAPSLALANFYGRDRQFDKADEFYLKSYAAAAKNFGKESKQIEQIRDARACSTGGRNVRDEKLKIFDEAVKKITGEGNANDYGPSLVLNGKALSLPQPEYPIEARNQRLSGTAAIRVTIDGQGNVVGTKSICRNDALGKAAEEAARKAKFSPTLKDGKPIEVTGIITYNFIL